jgi:hypothetical protein
VPGLFEITRAIMLQIWTFVNSKLKSNGMNGVEEKFKNRTLRQSTKGCGTQSLGEPGCHPPKKKLRKHCDLVKFF